MAQIFRPYANTLLRVALLAIVILPIAAVAGAYAVMWSPYITGENVTLQQPVPFSHEHHVGQLGLDCRYCHTAVETSAVASVPPTHTCMTCHSQLFTNTPVLRKVVESYANGKPIYWNRVYRLPAYVYFNHAVHVNNGVGCTTCHGRIDKMPLTRQAAPLTMSWCLDCHRNPAQHLRPKSEIFSTDWKPLENQLALGKHLLDLYKIKPARLSECSVCHR
jgi:hypothetical protein